MFSKWPNITCVMDNVQCTSKFASRECRMLTCAHFGWRISMMSDVVWSASTIGQLDMATSRCRVGIGPLWALEWEANSWLCTIAVLVSGTRYFYQAHNTCIMYHAYLYRSQLLEYWVWRVTSQQLIMQNSSLEDGTSEHSWKILAIR